MSTPTPTSRRRVHLAAALVAGATASAGLLLPGDGAQAAPDPVRERAVEQSGTPGAAWEDSDYTPQRGHWRDYVLAPESRVVPADSVELVDERGGSVTGAADAVLHADGDAARITSTGGRDRSPLVVVDFGKEVSGPVEVLVDAASEERPDLHVCYSESLQYLARFPGQNDGQTAHAPGCDTANIWNGFPGQPYTYDSDSHTLPLAGAELPGRLTDPELRGGYRYATLFLDGPGWVDVDEVRMQFTAAQGQGDALADYAGHFLSSDHLLNKIWYAGAYTVQINTDRPDTAKKWPYQPGEPDHADDVVPGADPATDVIYDGGKRDRIIWQGDLAVQAPVAWVSTYDRAAVDNSLSALAKQQLDDGYVPAASLVGQHNLNELRVYGEYVTWFVSNLAEHHRWTGDDDYLRQWWPAMERAVAWLEAQRDGTGLISMQASGSCGHYGYRNCGHETYNNALYVRNLEQMAALAGAAGDPGAAQQYDERADAVRDAINAQLWDDEAGAYRLSTEIPSAYPQDGNATAVLTGVADAEQARRALRHLRRSSWGELGSLTVSPSTPNSSLSPFYAPLPSWFEVDARLSAPGATEAQQQSAFTLMKRFWGWQLRQDPGSTFWEHVQPNGNPNLQQFSSLAHGWAAGPTVSMTTHVLGVNPVADGFARFDVAPHPGDLRWAEGTVPTPHGDVDVAWDSSDRGFAASLTVPSGTEARFVSPVPGAGVKVLLDGVAVWEGASLDERAALVDGRVVVDPLEAGRHQVRVVRLGKQESAAEVTLSPARTIAESGDLVAYDATVAAGSDFRGHLDFVAPAGWSLSRDGVDVRLDGDGAAGEDTFRFYVQIPVDAATGDNVVTARLSWNGGTAEDSSTVRLSRTETISDFEGDADGWQAGENVTSVASVGSFANGPGRPYAGSGALEAVSAQVAGDVRRWVHLEPETPLDLAEARSLVVRVDGYGGLPGATGYEAVVRLTGADGTQVEKAFPISADAWNTLEVDLTAWSGKAAVGRLDVGFRAVGASQLWLPRFQVDQVEWVG